MVFREGRTKAVGNVTKVFPHIPGVAPHGSKLKMQAVHHSHPPLGGGGGSHGRGKGRRGGRKKAATRLANSGDHMTVSSSSSISSTISSTSLINKESTPSISST